MESNSIQVTNKTGRNAAVVAMEQSGFAALRSGLGVMPGKYSFSTPNSEEIYATKPIESAKGKFGLTLVSGTLKGADDHNKETNLSFGLTPADKQLVVTYDQWLQIEPNQAYDVVVNDKGRIASITLASAEVLATN